MSELRSVVLAVDMATRVRDDAGKLLLRAQRKWRAALDQIEQLESYAADTESKWSVTSQVCAVPEIVRNYYQFMGRLQQAIDLQRGVIADLQREIAAAKVALLDAEIRIASLNKLLSKKQTVIERRQAVRDQRQLDEFAAMQHRRLRLVSETLETP